MIMIIDDTENQKITHIQQKNAHKLEIMVQASSNFIEGNGMTVSIHEILCETYHKLLNLDCEYTKTYTSEISDLINEKFPVISYGKNYVAKENINTFFKNFTNIDKRFDKTSTQKVKSLSEKLENSILIDLQQFIGVFMYYQNKKSTPTWKKFIRGFYQPVKTFHAYRHEKYYLNEFYQIFSAKEVTDIFNFILAVNNSIENFLILMGGREYCKNILDKKRDINSIDLLIYSAFKAEMKRDKLNVELSKCLSDNIDILIREKSYIKNEICLLDKNTQIAPKYVPRSYNEFKDYPDLDEKNFNFKKELLKRLSIFISFFGLIIAMKIKK